MKLKAIASTASLLLLSMTAHASIVSSTSDDGNTNNLQSVLDGITVGGPSSVDVYNDYLDDGLDSYWNITASGGSVSTFVMEIAGNSGINTFGVYDRNDSTRYVELFSGSDTYNDGFNSQVTLSILADGSVGVSGVDSGIDFSGNAFGYYIGAASGMFYSDSSLNPNGSDQMVAYQGTGTDIVQIPGFASGDWTDNEFILAFEDIIYADSDQDFNDLVVMVESVLPVPEPGTLALLGLGLAGLGVSRRRKQA